MKGNMFFNVAIVVFVAIVFIVITAEKKDDKKEVNQETIVQEGKKIIGTKVSQISPEHKFEALDCKSCHACEYPTISDPCLLSCPRDQYISIYHSPEEGPEVSHLNEIDGMYGEVLFSHKIHAQMSVMSGGCETCHHYNTTGPVLKCGACHENKHDRVDKATPSLEAAYHRQCLSCHRQWSKSSDCNFCHVKPGQDIQKIKAEKLAKFTGLSHPELHEPMQVVYETDYDVGPLVTFHHNEHINLFNQDCGSCHKNESCMKCHDVLHTSLRGDGTMNSRKEVHLSFDEHHKQCIACHTINEYDKTTCGKCHDTKVKDPFNHSRTGFDLSKYHDKLKCNDCHKTTDFKGLNSSCSSCHNFNSSNFKHAITGVVLDDMHSDFECSDCHTNNNFQAKPNCMDCHDADYQWPKKVPGKLIK